LLQGTSLERDVLQEDSGKLAAEGWGSITRAIVGHSRYHLAHVYEAQLRAHALRRCPLVFPFAAKCSKLQPCIAIAALAGCDNQLSSNFGTGRSVGQERRLGSPRCQVQVVQKHRGKNVSSSKITVSRLKLSCTQGPTGISCGISKLQSSECMLLIARSLTRSARKTFSLGAHACLFRYWIPSRLCVGPSRYPWHDATSKLTPSRPT